MPLFVRVVDLFQQQFQLRNLDEVDHPRPAINAFREHLPIELDLSTCDSGSVFVHAATQWRLKTAHIDLRQEMEAGARTHQAPHMARKGVLDLAKIEALASQGGALRLSDYPGDAVHVVCDKCERRGLYSKDRLIVRYGAEIGLLDLLNRIAADCPRVVNPLGNDLCGAHYPELLV